MLFRFAYLTVTHAFAALRLLPMSGRDKDAEILALRRVADAPQHSEALGELATLIEQFNAPKTGEPSGPPADEVMQHPVGCHN